MSGILFSTFTTHMLANATVLKFILSIDGYKIGNLKIEHLDLYLLAMLIL